MVPLTYLFLIMSSRDITLGIAVTSAFVVALDPFITPTLVNTSALIIMSTHVSISPKPNAAAPFVATT